MDTDSIYLIIIQFVTVMITLTSVIILYKTIQNSKNLNQNNLFNELVKQERELRIKLSEYRIEIDKRLDKNKKFEEITLNYDTLLFNYYEYLAICVYRKLINEKETKLYFKNLLKDVRQMFEDSILFEEGYAKKEDYHGLRWLFNQWKIEYHSPSPFTTLIKSVT